MNISDFSPVANSQRMNTLMKSRFGFSLDYNKLTYAKAQHLEHMIGENIKRIRHSYGVHTAERNPKYMELLMVRESLNRWMRENQNLMESEMGKSEAILAAKDMVDSIQDMVEKVSKMQVEQLPALIDTIRDQIGMAEADQFKSAMGDLLQNISQSLSQARETADSSARSLAGEDMGGGMGMPGMGDTIGAEPAGAAVDLGAPSDLDMDSDEFAATDAAAGGEAPVGREKR
jgi:DNA-binding transcriptional regulator YiaG